jgi:hypothetical protein
MRIRPEEALWLMPKMYVAKPRMPTVQQHWYKQPLSRVLSMLGVLFRAIRPSSVKMILP